MESIISNMKMHCLLHIFRGMRHQHKEMEVKNLSIRQTQSDITCQYNEFTEGTQSSAQPIIYVKLKKKFKMHVFLICLSVLKN
jgi:flagella basal body P-ring formation protein FlgA